MHLSKQLVGPKKKKVSSRLGAFLRDSKNGDGSVLPPLQSHISPLVVLLPLALRRGGSCIPCSIAYMLLVQSSSATSTTAGPQPQTDTIPRQTSSMGPYPHPSAGLHATTAAHNVQHTGKRNAEIDGGISRTQSTSVTADQSVTFAHVHSTNPISHAIQSPQNTSVMANELVPPLTNPRNTEPQRIPNTAQHGEFPLHRIAGIPVARNCGAQFSALVFLFCCVRHILSGAMCGA